MLHTHHIQTEELLLEISLMQIVEQMSQHRALSLYNIIFHEIKDMLHGSCKVMTYNRVTLYRKSGSHNILVGPPRSSIYFPFDGIGTYISIKPNLFFMLKCICNTCHIANGISLDLLVNVQHKNTIQPHLAPFNNVLLQ